jgi:hypothetical protein
LVVAPFDVPFSTTFAPGKGSLKSDPKTLPVIVLWEKASVVHKKTTSTNKHFEFLFIV